MTEDETIDELNASSDFQGTSFSKKKLRVQSKTWLSSTPFKVLAVLALLSSGLYIYFRVSNGSGGVEQEFAKANQHAAIETLSTELNKVAASKGSKQEKAQEIISLIQQSRETNSEVPLFPPNAEIKEGVNGEISIEPSAK